MTQTIRATTYPVHLEVMPLVRVESLRIRGILAAAVPFAQGSPVHQKEFRPILEPASLCSSVSSTRGPAVSPPAAGAMRNVASAGLTAGLAATAPDLKADLTPGSPVPTPIMPSEGFVTETLSST